MNLNIKGNPTTLKIQKYQTNLINQKNLTILESLAILKIQKKQINQRIQEDLKNQEKNQMTVMRIIQKMILLKKRNQEEVL